MRRIVLFAALAFSCSTEAAPSVPPATVTREVGPEGAVIEVDGATVTFARDAMPVAKTVTITATDQPAPPGYVALSKVYRCEPSGTDFPAGKVTMSMKYRDDGKQPTIFWTAGIDPSFKALATTRAGERANALVEHFSQGFVGVKSE